MSSDTRQRLLIQKIKLNSLKRLLPLVTIAFICLIAYFLYQNLSKIEWSEIQSALSEVNWTTVGICLLLTFFNYFIYACYDILSFNIIRNASLKLRKIISSTMIAFAFNLNLGALIGGIGLRYRIYSGWGIPKSKITLLTLLSTITSWSGYALLVSMILLFRPQVIGQWISFQEWIFNLAGLTFLIALFAYLYFCKQRKVWHLKEHEFQFPPVQKALLQFTLSGIQWSVVSFIIFLFLTDSGSDVRYENVLFSVLISGIAGVITHIPAGLGVLETVFLRMHENVPVPKLLAALLCYRFVYYLVPLSLAVPGYLYVEYYQKKGLNKSLLQSLRNRFKS